MSDLPEDGDDLQKMLAKMMQIGFDHGQSYQRFMTAHEDLAKHQAKVTLGWEAWKQIMETPEKKEQN